MNRESQQSWWRELGAISRGLDFLQGGGSFDPSGAEATQTSEPAHATPVRRNIALLLHNLVYLGGRQMHAGHNDDLDESFETLPRLDNTCRTC